MSSAGKPPNDKTVFDHPAFDYKGGAKMREFRDGNGWLPYFERWVLVIWLYIVAFAFQAILDLYDPFGRFWVATVGMGGVLIGMHLAFRRSGRRNAVLFKDKQRRRWLTGLVSTGWMLVWIGLVYVVLG